MRVWSWATRR